MQEGKWVTLKDGRKILIKEKDINNYMNNKIRNKGKEEKRKYIGEVYTSENVNNYFSKITNYEELDEFRNDYQQKTKAVPFIVPIKDTYKSPRQWVDFIQKIDDNNISFSVLSEDYVSSRKTKSSIKNFVKNYKVHHE